MNVSGTVVSLEKRGGMSKAGKPFTVHAITLDSGQTLEVGFKQPYVVGQKINVEAEMKFGKLAVVSGGSTTGGGGSAPSAPAVAAFPVALQSKDMSICRQSALKAAIDLHTAVLKAGATVSDELVEEIITTAYKFTDFSSGHRELKMLKEGVE